jgi:hypothetical protein
MAGLLDSGLPSLPVFARVRRPDVRLFSRLSTALVVGLSMAVAAGVPQALAYGRVAGLASAGLFGLLFGAVAGLLGAGGPVRGPRWFRRGTGVWRSVGGAMLIGLGTGVPVGLVIWMVLRVALSGDRTPDIRSPLYGVSCVLTGMLIGLALGAVSGVLRWMQAPAPADDSPSPRSLLGGDRRLVLGFGLLLSGAAATPMLLVMPAETRAEGVVLIGALAVWVPIAVRTWPRYVISRTYLALRGRLPWRLLPFLAHAYDVTALRQVGGVYQFRHTDLQEYLSRR